MNQNHHQIVVPINTVFKVSVGTIVEIRFFKQMKIVTVELIVIAIARVNGDLSPIIHPKHHVLKMTPRALKELEMVTFVVLYLVALVAD
jgi:hypothetical protein